jgi:alkylation response protein AidB-like acyl-CoA dehydrogenase
MRDGVSADPLARARALGPAIAAAADAIERTQRLPAALLDALHEANLFRLLLPRSLGGEEVDPLTGVLVIAELSRHDASVGWCMTNAWGQSLMAPHLDPEAARTIWGPPRAVVAWGPPNEARGTAVPGGYRLSGRWRFASGCRHATWMGAHGQVLEPDGSLRTDATGRPVTLTWLFPIDRVRLLDDWNPIGLRGTASESYEVTDLFVADAYTGTREDPDGRREPGPLYAFPQLTMYSIGIASVALGIARGLLDAYVALAGVKTPRGTVRMADSAAVQADVARCEARLGAAQAYLTQTVGEIYARVGTAASIGIEDRARCRLAGVNAIHGATEVADRAYKASGVDGIFPGSPFERRFRDMHTLSQQIQAREVHYETVGKVLLGNPPPVVF